MSLPGTRAACHCSQLQLWLLQCRRTPRSLRVTVIATLQLDCCASKTLLELRLRSICSPERFGS